MKATLRPMMIALTAAVTLGCGAAPGAAPLHPATPAATDAPPRATIALGELVGRRDGGVVRFDGVPYAAAPVGELRLAAPQPATPWTAPRDATDPAPSCVQPAGDQSLSGAEDCLYLNVTAPAGPSTAPRPVMVWLHGGAFEQGSAPGYDPRRLAEEGDVVVVTVGFRLGPLGMLALPGLDGGGTFGLADQVAALRFVQENAAGFGGDAGNVTVFGESGGAAAVCHLITSPQTTGLIHRAIIQSASAIRQSFPDRAEAVLAEYPLAAFSADGRDAEGVDAEALAWAAVYTDVTFACPQLHANDVLFRGTDVYAYEFADRTAASPLPVIDGAPAPGAAHSAELHYLFDMAAQPIDINGRLIPLTEPQRTLASTMIDVWSGFARTGTAPVPVWAEGGQALNFDEHGTSTIDPAQRHRCAFWGIGR